MRGKRVVGNVTWFRVGNVQQERSGACETGARGVNGETAVIARNGNMGNGRTA